MRKMPPTRVVSNSSKVSLSFDLLSVFCCIFPLPNTRMYVGCSYDSNGRRYKTNEGLTKQLQDNNMRRNKTISDHLNSRVWFLSIAWTTPNSDEYTKAIDVINDCYRKMLMIGKSKEVFRLPNNKIPDLLSARTYSEFILAKNNLE